jgi:hypothetical protein
MTYSKTDLLASKFQKGESVHGPSHDGGPKPGFYAKEGEGLVSHPHSQPNIARGMEHQATNPTLARGTGKMKRLAYEKVPIHSAMGGGFNKVTNDGAYDADPAAAMGGPPAGKRTLRAEINPGCRSRNADSLASESAGVAAARAASNGHEALHALGVAILNEARLGEHSSGLKIGAVPGAVEEN